MATRQTGQAFLFLLTYATRMIGRWLHCLLSYFLGDLVALRIFRTDTWQTSMLPFSYALHLYAWNKDLVLVAVDHLDLLLQYDASHEQIRIGEKIIACTERF